MRKISWLAAGIMIAAVCSGCQEKESLSHTSAEESFLMRPTFSSEQEMIEAFREEPERYTIYTVKDENPDLFARLVHIPEDYRLDTITWYGRSADTDDPPSMAYTYLSEDFLVYSQNFTYVELADSEVDAAYHDRENRSMYYFRRSAVPAENGKVGQRMIRREYLEEVEGFSDVYANVRWQQDFVRLVWLDTYGHICELQLPYDRYSEEKIPEYTAVEYFCFDLENGELVMVE